MYYRKRQKRILRIKNEYFVNAHLEAAAEFIPTKQRTKSRAPWKISAVGEKRADVKMQTEEPNQYKCPET